MQNGKSGAPLDATSSSGRCKSRVPENQ